MMKASSPPAELVTISESDVAALARFIASQSGRDSRTVESHLRWFLLDNPARDPQIPLGCGLRLSNGEFVGCILYVPQIFRFQKRTLPVVWSSCFYVDKDYRRDGGLKIFFTFAKLASTWPLCANSTNADAAKFWKVQKAVPIPDSDHELFGVLRWRGMIEEVLNRRGVPHAVARATSRPAALLVRPFKRLKLETGQAEFLVRLNSAEQVAQLPIHDPAPELTTNRDLAYIRWRYFSGRDQTVAAFAFRNKQVDSEVLVTVNQRPRGYRGQICSLNLLDIYPVVTPEICASIVAALAERYRNSVDAIVLRGLGQAHQNGFLSRGFLRRPFEAPNGWMLDKSGALPTHNWHFVPADGDWLI